MIKLPRILTLLPLLAAVGCTSTGAIPIGNDTYLISRKSAGGAFANLTELKASVLKEASDYCVSQGRTMNVLAEKTLGAIPMFRMPSTEVRFQCLKA